MQFTSDRLSFKANLKDICFNDMSSMFLIKRSVTGFVWLTKRVMLQHKVPSSVTYTSLVINPLVVDMHPSIVPFL